ncbi:hypothetical protein CBR_g62632 [Chara braunii]|uniref:Uncharacterized protein n=1 Tax=Chara braunii TaxID=69332 RepID=A0A388MFD5_CHABU|nr:hypothetical protein CBR_g62632 [Chara braunii]|eukprot:GBG93276.1 hypothetical protein CBR_g62632 [Chara braunii]
MKKAWMTAREDLWLMGRGPWKGMIDIKGSRTIIYMAPSTELRDWLIHERKVESILVGYVGHEVQLVPWRTPAEMEFQQEEEKRQRPWVKVFTPPSFLVPLEEQMVQQPFGEIVSIALFCEEEREYRRYVVRGPLKMRQVERVAVAFGPTTTQEFRFITSETPFCDVYFMHGHLGREGRWLSKAESARELHKKEIRRRMDPILASNVEEERRAWREIEQRYDAVVLKELQAAHWRVGGPEVAEGYRRRQDSKPRGRHTQPPRGTGGGKVEILEGKEEDSQGRLDGQALRISGGETGQTKEVLRELGGECKQKGQVGLDEICPGKVPEDINEANGWSNEEVVESSGRMDAEGGGGNRKESTPGGKVGESEVLPGGGQTRGEDKQVMLDCVRANILDRKVGEEETVGGNSKERTPGGKFGESEALQGGGQERGRTRDSGGKEEVGAGGRGEKDGSGDGSRNGEPPLGQQQECWLLIPYGRTEMGAESTNVHIPVPGGAKEGESDDVEVVDLAASLSALSPPPPPPPSHKCEPTAVTSDSGLVGMPRRRRKQLTSGPPISSPAKVGSSLQQATGAIQSDREEERRELQARVDAKPKRWDRSRSPAGRKVQLLKDEDRWVSPQRGRIEEEELQNKVAEEGLAEGMEDAQPRQPALDLDEPMIGDEGGDSTDDRGGAMDEDMDINEGMEADVGYEYNGEGVTTGNIGTRGVLCLPDDAMVGGARH